MSVLHIDSSVSEDTSVSRRLSAAAVREITAAYPGTKVVYRDLGAAPLDHCVMADKAGHDNRARAMATAQTAIARVRARAA